MIYLCDAPALIAEAVLAQTVSLMPPERLQRAARYRRAGDRARCILAYRLLMDGLREEYGIDAPPSFRYAPNGKPYLKEHPKIFFNISHCAAGVACAFADGEVGVDIQEVRPHRPAVAERVCTEAELAMLALSADPAREFCALWAVKESFAKRSGAGLAHPLRTISARVEAERAGADFFGVWGEGYYLACFGAGGAVKRCGGSDPATASLYYTENTQ